VAFRVVSRVTLFVSDCVAAMECLKSSLRASVGVWWVAGESRDPQVNINGIGSTNTIDALSALSNNPSTDGTDGAQGSATTPAASTRVSKPGEFMAKLSQLLSQDPAKFKQVTQQISDQL
jgi:hypothetical protein